jgi:hypothetical protein
VGFSYNDFDCISLIYRNHLRTWNWIGCIMRKITLRALVAQKRNIDYVETVFTSRTDYVIVRYSVTNNWLPIINRLRFEGNVVKPIVYENVLSRVRVTIDGVWIDEWIYWPLIYTRLGTRGNYSTTANLHNSQITTESAKPFPACCVFISRSLAMASKSGTSSAFIAQILSSWPAMQSTLAICL